MATQVLDLTPPVTPFHKFAQFTKVDAVLKQVTTVFTSESPDKDKERCDYPSTIPYYKSWSSEISKATDGKSQGNVRLMHQPIAVGLVLDIQYDDVAKKVSGTIQITDDKVWQDIDAGVYSGVSQGGKYIKVWKDATGVRWYTASPSEISIVDNPCNPDAHFEYIKCDGSSEMRKFSNIGSASEAEKVALESATSDASVLKSINDKLDLLLAKKEEAPVAEPNKTTEKPTCVCKDACCKCVDPKCDGKCCDKCAGAPAAKTAADKTPPDEKCAGKTAGASLKKSMYDVGSLAYILAQLGQMKTKLTVESQIENDGSPIPDALTQWIADGVTLITALVTEEGGEIVAGTGAPDSSYGGCFAYAAKSEIAKALFAELAKGMEMPLAKVGAKFSADSVEKLNKLTKMAGDHASAVEAAIAELLGDDDEQDDDEDNNDEQDGGDDNSADDDDKDKDKDKAAKATMKKIGDVSEMVKLAVAAAMTPLNAQVTELSKSVTDLTAANKVATEENALLKAENSKAEAAMTEIKAHLEKLLVAPIPGKGISKVASAVPVAVTKDADVEGKTPAAAANKMAGPAGNELLKGCLAQPLDS